MAQKKQKATRKKQQKVLQEEKKQEQYPEMLLMKRLADYIRENPGTRYRAGELAKWFMDNFQDECAAKKKRSKAVINRPQNRTVEAALKGQLIAEITAQRKSMKSRGIIVSDEKPRTFYYEKEKQGKTRPPNEEALYIPTLEFVFTERGVLGKRINEKRSSNRKGRGGNQWLHPDLVGMEDLSSGWDDKVKRYAFEVREKAVKLWSLEVKSEIKRSDLRDCFFQAVGNSSWANIGYLVACDIGSGKTKEGVLDELRILSGQHGIGFIQLNYNEPTDSQIIIPAQERENVDWSAASRLADENEDFRKYIELVFSFHVNGGQNISPESWDTPEVEIEAVEIEENDEG